MTEHRRFALPITQVRRISEAREEVVLAGAYLLYAREQFGGRLTAGDSASLDYAEDRLDDALKAWKQATA